MAQRRKPGQVPVGLQLRTHQHTGSQYWAVIAVQSMPSGSVGILHEYDASWQRPRKGSVAVTFLDELKPSSPDLDGYAVYVTRDWLESSFLEPSWHDFERSDCRVMGATVGIITGLLSPEGVPVHLAAARKGRAGVVNVQDSIKGMLPVLLINGVIMLLIWLASRYVERKLEQGP